MMTLCNFKGENFYTHLIKNWKKIITLTLEHDRVHFFKTMRNIAFKAIYPVQVTFSAINIAKGVNIFILNITSQ